MDDVVKGCSADECLNAHYAKGLCQKHWTRQWRTGTTADGPGRGRPNRPATVITECAHSDRKHYAKGKCRSCYVTQWMKEHPEADSGNTWLKNHPEAARLHSRRQNLAKRGTTPEEYDRLWAEQDGRCANPACDFTAPMVMTNYRQGLQADHDHQTGRPRGLLCPPCNRALGHIADDAERLAGLIEYLAVHALGLN
jgi:Recombination endonuclease VII